MLNRLELMRAAVELVHAILELVMAILPWLGFIPS